MREKEDRQSLDDQGKRLTIFFCQVRSKNVRFLNDAILMNFERKKLIKIRYPFMNDEK